MPPTIQESIPQEANEKFLIKIIMQENSRYQRKGYGLVVSFLIAAGFFIGYPIMMRELWPHLLKWQADNELSYTAFHLIISIGMHNFCHIGMNLVYWAFYHFEWDFIMRYKCNDLPWPWQEDNEAWRTLCYKSIFILLFNGNVMVTGAFCLADHFGLVEYHSMTQEDLPDTVTLMLTMAFFMLVEDFVFYWNHRFLHWRVIYPYFHKMHHNHKVTTGIAGEYTHPIEYVLANMMPVCVGPGLLATRCSMATVFAWYLIRYLENLDGHCGFDFSWSPFRLIPFSSGGKYHDFHHAVNVGNYASFFSIWDTVFGTNKVFYQAEKELEEEAAAAKAQ